MAKGVWITIAVIVVALIVGIFLWAKGGPSYEATLNSNLNYTGLGNSQQNSSDLENESDVASAGPKTYNVEMRGIAFRPGVLNISVGDTVKWTNMESATHTVISDSGSELLSERMYKDDVYEHTFTTAGTYEYHCSLHNNMPGKIVVK